MATFLIGLFLSATVSMQGVIGGFVEGVPQGPPRDPRAKPPVGTGMISGKVTAADTGAPLRRAGVSLNGPSQPKATLTDADGRYQFTNLPPGTYTVIANAGRFRAGYQAVAYGISGNSSAPFVLRGKPIELSDGQRLENINIALPRSGVIAGRVTDSDGQPASRISVGAWMLRPGSEPVQSGGAQTDDLGQFRLFGLAPGDYLLMANPSIGMELQGMSADADVEATGFAPTYAPGTPNRAEAMRLRVGRGTEVSADIRLMETRVYSISGTVTNSNGETGRTMNVMLMRSDAAGGSSMGVMVSPTGTFTLRNVPPGEYDLVARYMPGREPGPVAGPPAGMELASLKVNVASSNVDSILLVTQPGATVAGEVVFEDPLPEDGHANLFAQSIDRMPFVGTPQIELKNNTFTMRNVFAPVVLRGSVSAGPTWGLKAVLLNGKDITDVPTAFTANDSGHLQVVFTAKAPGLEGIVTDDTGKPTMDASVVVFGQDPATWQARSSFLRTMRVIKDGKFAINGLREGRYFAVALPMEASINITQPGVAFLETLSKIATPVVLNPGERRTLDLGVVRIPQ